MEGGLPPFKWASYHIEEGVVAVHWVTKMFTDLPVPRLIHRHWENRNANPLGKKKTSLTGGHAEGVKKLLQVQGQERAVSTLEGQQESCQPRKDHLAHE